MNHSWMPSFHSNHCLCPLSDRVELLLAGVETNCTDLFYHNLTLHSQFKQPVRKYSFFPVLSREIPSVIKILFQKNQFLLMGFPLKTHLEEIDSAA